MNTFDRGELLPQLETAVQATANTVDNITKMLIFHDGKVSCLDGSVECTVGCGEFALDTPFLVNSEVFIKFLKRLPKDEISYEVSGDTIKLKQGRRRATIAITEFDDGIMLPTLVDGIEFFDGDLDKVFFDGVKACLKTCSDKEAPILGNVCWCQEGLLLSTDKYAATKALVERFPMEFDGNIAIPSRALAMAAKFNCNLVGWYAENGYIYFINEEEDITIASNTYDNYPMEVMEFFEEGEEVIGEVEFPPNMMGVIERAEVFIDKKQMTDFVVVTSDGDRLTIKSQSEHGEFEESIRTIGPAFEFPCQPELLRTLGTEKNATIQLDKTKLVFSYDGGNTIHTISLR